MDPKTLIDFTNVAGLPAPWWFLRLLKVLGFTLHAVLMNLWYAGVLLAMLFYVIGGRHGRQFSRRLMAQMPVILAYGINFGIVPLLFLQVGEGKVFYPATVLMAWFWLAIIALLTLAYYGVYLNALGWREEEKGTGLSANHATGSSGKGAPSPFLSQAAGWGAAIFLICIGFTFVNAMSLMTNVKGWPALWQEHSVAGAALGTALNVSDPTLWPRWLMMFGLALTTTAAWIIVDLGFFAGRESADYRRWAQSAALMLYSVGIVWFAVAGSWYVFGTWLPEVWSTMSHGPLLILTVLTALSPGLPWLLILAIWRSGATAGLSSSAEGTVGQANRGSHQIAQDGVPGRGLALLVGLAQFGVLGINAVSRQIVQELELGLPGYFDVSAQPVQTQWSPLIVFLILLVLGLAVVAWMIAQVVKVSAHPAGQDGTV